MLEQTTRGIAMDCELNQYVYDCEECGFCKGERKMTNAEKYREEIMNYNGYKFCNDFIKNRIIKTDDCSGTDCDKCVLLQFLWLMEEYKEPEVDWSKVAVDTPILVKDYENETWYERHFAKYEDGKVYAWSGGLTSWTVSSNNDMTDWKFAKLAEAGEQE